MSTNISAEHAALIKSHTESTEYVATWVRNLKADRDAGRYVDEDHLRNLEDRLNGLMNYGPFFSLPSSN